VFITTGTSLWVVATNSSVYRWTGATESPMFERLDMLTMGCRLPPSASGSTVLQQSGILVDNQGGIWMATCSYFKFATNCPDFIGTTIEEGIILRNGVRFPDPGIRSEPETGGLNLPWNLKWCGGQMYIHTYPDPNHPSVPTPYGRWQGLSNPTTLAPATVNDCGSEPEPDPVVSAANPGTPLPGIGSIPPSGATDRATSRASMLASRRTTLTGPAAVPAGSAPAAVRIDEQIQEAPIDMEGSIGRWRPGRL
jgi:hypothetical protein